ncbi:MAG: hypothetical protein ACKN9V_07775, partial [Pseudomonadota bacterium]
MHWNKKKLQNKRVLVVLLIGTQTLVPSRTLSETRRLTSNEAAQVLFLQGIVRVDKKKATEPIQLKTGSIIETGKGHATVRIGNDQVVDMDEDSRLRVVKIKEKKDGLAVERLGVVLEKGGIRGTQDVEPSDPRANSNILTPSGLLRLNGGRFVVGVDPDKKTKVLTLDKPASLDPTPPPTIPNVPSIPSEERNQKPETRDDSKSSDLNDYKKDYTSNLKDPEENKNQDQDQDRDNKQVKNDDGDKDSKRSKDSGEDRDQGGGNDDRYNKQAKNDDGDKNSKRSKDSDDDRDNKQAKNDDGDKNSKQPKESGDDRDQGGGNDDRDNKQAKNDDGDKNSKQPKDSGDDRDQGGGNDDRDNKQAKNDDGDKNSKQPKDSGDDRDQGGGN